MTLQKILCVLLWLFGLFMVPAHGQVGTRQASGTPAAENEEFDSGLNRWFFTGNISPWFGNPTSVNVSPLVGYRVTQRYLVGGGIFYNYFRQRSRFEVFETSSYGGRLFNSYLITDQIFIGAELDYLNYEPLNVFTGEKLSRRWVMVPLVGGGYSARIGQRSRVFISLMYNLNFSANGPYGAFVPRMSFAF
jgi:hypothetical protein